MPSKSDEVDAYIANAQPFARPILAKIRTLFHRASPKIEEDMKWNHPSFIYKGIVGMMGGYKHSATWGLWKGKLVKNSPGDVSMGKSRLTKVSQLPPDKVMIDLIKQAVALNEQGVKPPPRKTKPKAPLKIPPDLTSALKKNAKAAKAYKAFSPSHKREYIEWITQAKQEETRKRRLAQAIEWITEGKSRNWKYM
ncbi:MAG TPA: YdeI/OmpD-associated family protein [Tepidisphaeraceae bacterium]|nr:YdeI/OmpD-associated family protein [Tepidisphaeraceae bacterium]